MRMRASALDRSPAPALAGAVPPMGGETFGGFACTAAVAVAALAGGIRLGAVGGAMAGSHSGGLVSGGDGRWVAADIAVDVA